MHTNQHLDQIDNGQDYEVAVSITYWLTAGRTGGPTTQGRYELFGSTDGEAWQLTVERVLVADERHGQHIPAEPMRTISGGADSPHPLALLAALVHGPVAQDGSAVVADLSEDEFAALEAAPPDLRDELVRVMTQAP